MGRSLPGDVTVNPVVGDVRVAVARDHGIDFQARLPGAG